jgi:GNAT superfamily N-acetyltransferase
VLRLLDRRADGHRLFEVGSYADLDLEALVPMLDRAWRLDYAGAARLDFDAAVLRRMMRDPWWVAVLAVDGDGRPSAFELALERTLHVKGRTLDAFYASVLTVSADHRRQGLGRFILEGINRLVFAERGSDVILSTFHEGHSGSPAVQSTFDRIPGWGVVRFHRTPIWSRRLDRDPLPPLDPAPVVEVLDARSGRESRIDLGALEAQIRATFSASFAFSESLGAQYLAPSDGTSGLLLYGEGSQTGSAAARDPRITPSLCGFNILPMAIEDHRLRPVGQLQLLHAPGATEERIGTIVHHLATFLAARGCFVMTALEMGVVSHAVLERLGFAATDTTIAFAARGPKRNLEPFEGLRPPFFLDFT